MCIDEANKVLLFHPLGDYWSFSQSINWSLFFGVNVKTQKVDLYTKKSSAICKGIPVT